MTPKLSCEQVKDLRRSDWRYGDVKRRAKELGISTETLRRARKRIYYKGVR